jgi:hypothetical protein
MHTPWILPLPAIMSPPGTSLRMQNMP